MTKAIRKIEIVLHMDSTRPVRGNLLHDDIVHGEREKGKEHGDDESGGKQVQGVKGKIFPYIFQGYG